jgi:hypothetical protein
MQQRPVALYWGIRNPQSLISVEVFDCMGTYVIEFYIERIAFYLDMFTSCLAAFWCICMYPWSSHHFRE